MIKNRINLYTDAFKPVPERFSLRQLLVLLVIIGASVASGLAYLYHQVSQLNAQVLTAEQRLFKSNQTLTELQNELKQRTVDPKLQRVVDGYQRDLKVKNLLLSRLDGQHYANQGFSETLTALASISQDQVWLTQIRSQGGRIALKGLTNSSESVPKWVGQFHAYPALASQSFSGLRIYREQEQQSTLNFELSSQAVEVVADE